MKDFRIVARIYNNQLRERREATGMGSGEFAKAIGIGASEYCALEAMRIKPIGIGRDRTEKNWKPIALKVAGALGVEPDVLWPEAVLEIEKTVGEVRVDTSDIAALLPPAESTPFLLLSAGEESAVLVAAIESLPDRERGILERHYFGGETLAEIADDIGVSRARVGEIERRVIRKLRADKAIRELGP